MDALAAEDLDDALAELAQADAAPREVVIDLGEPEQVALCGIGVHAEQQVRRRQVEEAERVALQCLGIVHEAALALRGGRDAHAEDRVPGLGAREHVAHRADAADARHQARHLVERPAFAELLEAAELRLRGTGRVRTSPAVVEVDGDLGVALDPGHGIDEDSIGHCAIRTSVRRCPARRARPSSRATRKCVDLVGRRRTALQVVIHLHHLVHRPHPLEQARAPRRCPDGHADHDGRTFSR